MPDRDDPLARLPRAEQERLARFVGRLERVPIEVMLTLAARPLDPAAHAAAAARAEDEARLTSRTSALARVRADADAWVLRLYNSSTNQPGWMEANWGRPGTTKDRANLATSLAEALTALVLWDRLDEADRDELVGPFASLVDESAS